MGRPQGAADHRGAVQLERALRRRPRLPGARLVSHRELDPPSLARPAGVPARRLRELCLQGVGERLPGGRAPGGPPALRRRHHRARRVEPGHGDHDQRREQAGPGSRARRPVALGWTLRGPHGRLPRDHLRLLSVRRAPTPRAALLRADDAHRRRHRAHGARGRGGPRRRARQRQRGIQRQRTREARDDRGAAAVSRRKGRGRAARARRPGLEPAGSAPLSLEPDPRGRPPHDRRVHPRGRDPHHRGAWRPAAAERTADHAHRLRQTRGLPDQRPRAERAAARPRPRAAALGGRELVPHLALSLLRGGDAARRPARGAGDRRDPCGQPQLQRRARARGAAPRAMPARARRARPARQEPPLRDPLVRRERADGRQPDGAGRRVPCCGSGGIGLLQDPLRPGPGRKTPHGRSRSSGS